MKVDVILHAHGLVKDAVIPVQALAQAPAQALAQAPAQALVRAVIISAQLPALNLVRAVPDAAAVEILAALDVQIVVREPAKAIVLEAAEPAVEDALHPVHQAVRAIVAGPVGISATDRRLHRYIQFD